METLHSNYIHIDSRNRSTVINLKKNNSRLLGKNPLLFTNNSNELIIYDQFHNCNNYDLTHTVIFGIQQTK